jgi:hypothetical protein
MLESIESRAYRLHETLEESFRISRAIALDKTARPMDRMRGIKKDGERPIQYTQPTKKRTKLC